MILRSNVVIEPLVEGWYAWAHLLSPATAAMNVVKRHLLIMDSYIKSPSLHAAAARNPDLIGGPFADYATDRSKDMAVLRDETVKRQAAHIEFAAAIDELGDMLSAHENGPSLESLYAELPECLKGYVELVYDIYHQPSFRFFEALLYNSSISTTDGHQIALYQVQADDDRQFILSTPRLPDENAMILRVPFNSDALRDLARARFEPCDVDKLASDLGLPADQRAAFEDLFEPGEVKTPEKWAGPGIRVRYFGHACVLIETPEVSILTDPIISYDYPTDLKRYTFDDLPESIDYVLLTHNHQDHILLESLLQLKHRIRNVVVPRDSGGTLADPSLRLVFESLGFENVISLSDLETHEVPSATITGLPFIGEHGDLDIRSKLCYMIKTEDRSILFAIDSRILDERLYSHVSDFIGNVDVMFIGMECDGAPISYLYGPLLHKPLSRKVDQERRLNGSGLSHALKILNCFEPEEVYVYALGMEPWLGYIMGLAYTETSNAIVESNQLIEHCSRNDIQAERLFAEREWIYRGADDPS